MLTVGYEERIKPKLPAIIRHFGTPFHLIDALGVIDTYTRLCDIMRKADEDYRNFFAVKALSDIEALRLVWQLGMGFDCSSQVEIRLARSVGAGPEDIICTSNDTPPELFAEALAGGGCFLNMDDIGLIELVPGAFPKFVCFRYNPGNKRVLDSSIGKPETCKYGVPHEKILDAYRQAMRLGAKRFGLHAMLVSNELKWECHAETFDVLLAVAGVLEDKIGIRVEWINPGGGYGIPYRPGEEPLNIEKLATHYKRSLHNFYNSGRGWKPRIYTENGRYIFGSHGIFVAECITEKHTYREFRGLNASAMASIMRPCMYHAQGGGYHHITVLEDPIDEPVECSVVGPACEDSDRFGWDRTLSLHRGQHAVVHNTGAHAPEMGNNYNNWPRPQVLMLFPDGRVGIIRPAETVDELFARRLKYLEPRYAARTFTP